MAKVGDAEYAGWSTAASGLAAVWATENTRESLFDAMKRKETYATTGSRMLVRFFGGWEFEEEHAKSRLPANFGYEHGVPMGGDLVGDAAGRAPSLLVAAMKDPLSGNLDRIQIVKVWVDAELLAVWEDPDFDASVPAAYYARVLEIPTPRWTAYEAKRFGVTMDADVPMVHQERAYTSPIWYTP